MSISHFQYVFAFSTKISFTSRDRPVFSYPITTPPSLRLSVSRWMNRYRPRRRRPSPDVRSRHLGWRIVVFSEIIQLHTAARMVWNHSCVTDGSWPKRHHESSSFLAHCTLQNPVPCHARVKILACACWLAGLSISLARTRTAWPRVPPHIAFD